MKVDKYKEIDYVIRKPKEYSSQEKYPLIIYLHGAGGRGRDVEMVYTHPFFSDTEEWLSGAICVVPQCYTNSWFCMFEQLQDFIKYAISWKNVDATRVYLVGASMGGYATWQMAMSHPEWFAGIIPICGGGMYWNTARLVNMGVWAFHGALDQTVYPAESEKMVEGIKKNGGTVRFTVYEDCAHNAWTPTFRNKEVWSWLLSCRLHYEYTKNIFDNVEQFG